MPTSSNEIIHDISPLLRVYKDGRVERLREKDIVPALIDHDTGVQSKDVEIAPEQNLSARLYLPKNINSGDKLPVLVFYHGGGFLVLSAFSPMYQKHLNLLVSGANVVAVSVNYRLAPEYPLPIAYEDSWVALKWVASHSKGDGNEVWLKDYADFNRVYIGGDSAGGNIAHNITLRAGLEKLDGIIIKGMFLDCPYFWGKDPIGNETVDIYRKAYMERVWLFAYPTSAGLDDPSFNPAMNPNLSSLGCKKVLVFVAEKDVLKDRGWYYKDVLIKSGWVGDVEVLEIQGEDHSFNFIKPTSDNAMAVMNKIISFLNQDD